MDIKIEESTSLIYEDDQENALNRMLGALKKLQVLI
jgi:hypothetical protein